MKNKVVILGAGYGGLMTAVKLEAKTRNLNDLEIVLIDKNPYHQYVHLSYEIVTDVKKVSDLTLPLAEVLAKRKIHFLQATVNGIDLHDKIVKTDKGEVSYNELVIALGNEPNFYGIKGAQEYSLSLNSVESAARIRNKISEIFSKDQHSPIIVGGGGFTGVELVGEILDEYKCCVTIVEGSDKLLSSWDIPEFSKKVATFLTDMGANLLLKKVIVEVKPDSIVLEDGRQIQCSLFIWTAGVQASTLLKKSGLKTGKGGRAVINEFCEAFDFPSVYVVGDSALVIDPDSGNPLPQCIDIALQQAELVSRNIVADLKGDLKTAFRPKFKGLILAVGEAYGIGKIFGVTIEGKVAQIVKRLVHLEYVYEIAGLREVTKESPIVLLSKKNA